MFRERIESSPFYNTAANSYFKKIFFNTSHGYGGWLDNSFISTLRAFVYPRMGDDDRIFFNPRETDYAYFLTWSNEYYVDENVLSVINMRDCPGDFAEFEGGVLRALPSLFNVTGASDGEWKRLEKVTEFFRKIFGVICYVNPKTRSTLLILKNANLQLFHYLQCGILAFLPWYFDKDNGISEDDRELIESLRDKSPERYMRILEKMAKPFDFRSLAIKEGLNGFETIYEQIRLRNINDELSDLMRRIDELYDMISGNLTRKRDLEINLAGVQAKIAAGSEGSDVMDYFLAHKNLHFIGNNEGELQYAITGYVSVYNEDLVETMINNSSSIFYTSGPQDGIHKEDMGLLLRKIFVDQEFKLRFCAAYSIDIMRQRVDGLYNYPYAARLGLTDYMPNPHVNKYNCLGDYKRGMIESLGQNDYMSCIEQTIASAISLNFGDGFVMSEFMSYMYGNCGSEINRKCIELPDGMIVTPEEAVEFLKKEEEETNE